VFNHVSILTILLPFGSQRWISKLECI